MAYTPDAGIPRGLDYRCACEILAAVVKTAVKDWRSGDEPGASQAGEWLDDALGYSHWRDVAQQDQRQFQRARPR
jgi:hypothetical protein